MAYNKRMTERVDHPFETAKELLQGTLKELTIARDRLDKKGQVTKAWQVENFKREYFLNT